MENDPHAEWLDARRIESFAGETRTNAIRAVGIVVLYTYHVLNILVLHHDDQPAAALANITILVICWSAVVLLVQLYVTWRLIPEWLKYLSVAADAALISMLLVLTRDPKSAFVAMFFVVIFSSALRLSLGLVWFATLLNIMCFAGFHGYVRFGLALPDELRMARSSQVVFVVLMAITGLLAGQCVRQAARLAFGRDVIVVESEERS